MLQEITKEGNALLSAIRNSESSLGDKAYNMRFSSKGGATFSSYDKHPRIYEHVSWRIDGKKSDASGAYQFLSSTFNPLAKQHGIKDFSPASQDKAAWILAQTDYKRKTGQDLQEALEQGAIDKVFKNLSGTWTSLPSGKEANKLTGKAHQTYTNTLTTDTGKFYGGIRKTGCDTRNAILSTIPFWDYEPVNCEPAYAEGTGIGFEGESVEEAGFFGNIFIRVGYAVLGVTLLVVGFNKLKV